MNKTRVPTKVEYKNASENSGYHAIKLNNTQTKENKTKYRRSRNIIWFNLPCGQNARKHFLSLLDYHFPKFNKLHKIFYRNTVKVSNSCTENTSSIISSHNKKLIKNNAKYKAMQLQNQINMPHKQSMSISGHNLQMHCFNISKPR